MTGEVLACVTCEKSVYKQKCHVGGLSFCSKPCADKYAARTKIRRECVFCKEEFLLSPSRLQQIAAKYCSIECRTSDPEWVRRAVIQGNIAQQRRTGPNRLELAGEAILDELGVSYQTQVLLCEKFLVDAYLPSHRLVIQWDGDFWHGHPSKLKTGPALERQLRRRKLDASQNSYLRKAGYTVLRFWESEVSKEKDKVSATIRRAIQKAA